MDIKSHQEIGNELNLFMFSPYSPGSCMMLPHGQVIYNKMMDMLRKEYRRRGYKEVSSPMIYNADLWKKSGHWDNYKENMFILDVDEDKYSLKGMNCPGHCLMYSHGKHSYRDLPIRYADFGILHRNEMSGSLTGLTRVRKFTQDDAHIFCRSDQIQEEISGCLDFLDHVYKLLGLDYEVTLSTRPDKFIGDIKRWEDAEDQLKKAIESKYPDYVTNDKDGAFYGPKIDIIVTDSFKRRHQCGTIQLDMQLPERFELTYKTEDSEDVPIIIHRAIYGSFERMLAVMLESTQGELPFWMSPRQVAIVPIIITDKSVMEYCKSIHDALYDYECFFDDGDNRFQHKIASAEVKKFSKIIVIGKKEVERKTINLREGKKNTEMTIIDFMSQFPAGIEHGSCR